MKFLGLGFFESIDITSSFLALKNHPTVSKSSVIAMEGYKIYYCYPAFSTYGIALDQVMFSNKLYVFFQNYTVGLGGGRGGGRGICLPCGARTLHTHSSIRNYSVSPHTLLIKL